jgi:hypothetical protein
MRLRTFFVGTGDCLLLSSREGNNVLIDGGPTGGYFTDNVLPTLQAIRGLKQHLDIALITHIDDDHIDGILHALTLYQSQTRRGLPHHIPRIGSLWHNSWGLQHPPVKRAARTPNHGPGAQTAPSRFEPMQRIAKNLAAAYADINYSAPQAAQAAWLAALGQRPIRRNVGFGGRFIELTDPARVRNVSPTLSLTVLGPTAAALDELREVFADAGLVSDHTAGVVRSTAAELTTIRDERDDLVSIGDAGQVTVANRASIIVLATDTGRGTSKKQTCLLTGDATAQAILHGLHQSGMLTDSGPPLRCTVLKVQHHGAEDNYTWRFSERVVADHYVISADGQHQNPDTNVMHAMIAGRAAAAPNRPFTVWFTCTPERSPQRSQTAMAAGINAAIAAADRVNERHPELAAVRVLKATAPHFDICMCSPGQRRKTCACTPPNKASDVLVAGRHQW